MSTVDTKGWDLVGGITQSGLNEEIGKLFKDGVLPSHIQESITYDKITGSVDMYVDAPSVDLAGVTQGIAVLTMPIKSGSLKVEGYSIIDLAGGVVTVSTAVQQVQVELAGKKKVKIYLDMLSSQMIVTAKISGIKPFPQAVLNALLDYFLKKLKKGTYYLGTVDMSGIPIPDYLVPKTVDFMLVPYKGNPKLNELLIMVQTLGHGGRKDYRDPSVPGKSEVVTLVSNERLLVNVIGEPLKQQMPGSNFTYSPNKYVMSGTTKFNGYDLRGAAVFVKDDKIHITLNIAAMHQAGGGINIYINSDTSISITYDSAKKQFIPASETPKPNTSWTLEWWVYLIAGLVTVLLGLVAGIVAIVVSVVIGVIANAVAGPQAQGAINKAFSGALEPINWPASQYFQPSSVNLPGPLQLPGTVE